MCQNLGVSSCELARFGGYQIGDNMSVTVKGVTTHEDEIRRLAASLAPSDMAVLNFMAPESRVYWLRDHFGVSRPVAFKVLVLLRSGVES